MSVVVPTRGKGSVLARCVTAVLAQRSRAPLEVIVVDNEARPGQAVAVLGALAHDARVRVLHEPVPGAAAARNTGILAARHDAIACVDADCVPDPGWLDALATALGGGADLAGGAVHGIGPDTAIGRCLDRLYDQRKAIETYRPSWVISCNLMARRDTLLAWGLFDERFLRGQDVELVYRVHVHASPRLAYAADAVVRHEHDTGMAALVHKGYQHGLAAAAVMHVYAAPLGLSRARRLRDWRAWTMLVRAAFAVVIGGGDAARDRLCDAVVRAARHVGMVRGTLAWRGRPTTRATMPCEQQQEGREGSSGREPSALERRVRVLLSNRDADGIAALRLRDDLWDAVTGGTPRPAAAADRVGTTGVGSA